MLCLVNVHNCGSNYFTSDFSLEFPKSSVCEDILMQVVLISVISQCTMSSYDNSSFEIMYSTAAYTAMHQYSFSLV